MCWEIAIHKNVALYPVLKLNNAEHSLKIYGPSMIKGGAELVWSQLKWQAGQI